MSSLILKLSSLILSCCLCCFSAQACPETSTDGIKFASAHAIAVDGSIENGILYTDTNYDGAIRSQINSQLYYTIGQLNGETGVADMNRLKIEIINKEQSRFPGLYKITYKAELFIAWPRAREIPESYQLIVPGQGGYTGRSKFFQRYGSDEASGKRCLAASAHEVSMGIFWYYYRPLKSTCSLKDSTLLTAPLVVNFPMKLKKSDENTQGKSPEYEKVWEDGKLIITAILGMNEANTSSEWDAGVSAYRELYQNLIGEYGAPFTTNLPLGTMPGIHFPEVRMNFFTEAGEVDVALFLVQDIKMVDAKFMEKYNQRTKNSDFISYSGHSGLGANIRALANMGQFISGQYQIFLVNGCDTFAYVDNSLQEAHHRVNLSAEKNKYFDLITNAMPSYFHFNARSNMQVIMGLVGSKKNYRQILSGFSFTQKAVVTGEEDNNWPLPF